MSMIDGVVDRLVALEPTYKQVAEPVETFGYALVALWCRLWLAWIFFGAGMTRWNNWGSQDYLFSIEHPLPILPPIWWATITTAAELLLPVLLVLGFAGRLGALGVLAMACVIQFYIGIVFAVDDFGDPTGYYNVVHYYWMVMALVIITKGSGLLSIDAYLSHRVKTG